MIDDICYDLEAFLVLKVPSCTHLVEGIAQCLSKHLVRFNLSHDHLLLL